ncbi:hypothetical protein H0H93_007793 [Arthromyces matolae]|nr:hypothetical protein H0H93_007793 [Arthromyces matolae]
MSPSRSALPFLGAIGVTLTTLAVGYYTYKYTRNDRTQLRPRSPRAHSGHTLPSQNNVPPHLPSQPPIQNNVHLQHRAANFHTPQPSQPPIQNNVHLQHRPPNFHTPQNNVHLQLSPANSALPPPPYQSLPHNFSTQTQNFALPQQGPPRRSLRDHEARPSRVVPPPPPPLHMTAEHNYRGEEMIALLPYRFSSAEFDRKSCQATMFQEEITLNIIEEPTSRETLETAYTDCVRRIRDSSQDISVVANIGEEHASSLLSLIRLRKMLERIAADDTTRHCRSLEVNLPANMGYTSESNEAFPGLLPLPTILPQLETLLWTSSWKQLHLIAPDPNSLNHLTNLTLESQISVPDAIYLLHCVRQSLERCSIKHLNDVHEHTDNYTDVFPAVPDRVTLKVKSFSVHANSFASSRLFLNRLQFDGVELTNLNLKVDNGLVNPRELGTIPWTLIRNIRLNCDLVTGGDAWVRGQAGQAAACILGRHNVASTSDVF